MPIISAMEYIGVFAFAISGAFLAIQYKMDLFGIFILAGTTAVGGGILRDVVMNVGVPTFFSSYTTIFLIALAVLAAIIITVSTRMKRGKLWQAFMQVTDAIGLAVFAIDTGVKGINSGYNLPQFLFVSLITAVGGGVIRDLMCQRVPQVLQKEVYASAALSGAIFLWIAHPVLGIPVATYLALAVVFGVRMVSVVLNLDLPTVQARESLGSNEKR